MKTFSKKFNAQRAAKAAAAKAAHLEVVEIEPGRWALETVPPPQPKAARPAKAKPAANGAARPRRRTTPSPRAEIEAAAQAGHMPAAPDFSAKTHARYRKRLAELVALAQAGDVKALRAFPINPYSSSPKALDRYRNLCVVALKAKTQANA